MQGGRCAPRCTGVTRRRRGPVPPGGDSSQVPAVRMTASWCSFRRSCVTTFSPPRAPPHEGDHQAAGAMSSVGSWCALHSGTCFSLLQACDTWRAGPARSGRSVSPSRLPTPTHASGSPRRQASWALTMLASTLRGPLQQTTKAFPGACSMANGSGFLRQAAMK